MILSCRLMAAAGGAGDDDGRMAFAASRPAPSTCAGQHMSNAGANRGCINGSAVSRSISQSFTQEALRGLLDHPGE
jgi:hypothetical protein